MQPAQLIQLLLCFLVVPATDAQRGNGPQTEEPFVPPGARRLLIEVNGDGQCRAPEPNCTDLIGGKCISLSNVCTLCGSPGRLLAAYRCNGGPEDFCCVTGNECIDAGGSCQFKLPWQEGGSEGRESDDSMKFTTALRCGNNTQLQCFIDSLKAECAEKTGVCTDSEACRDGRPVRPPCGSDQLCCVPDTVRACTKVGGECIPVDQTCCGEVCDKASLTCTASTKCCIPHVADDPSCSIFPNVNFAGNILETIPSVKSQACCKNMCTFSEDCTFFKWIGPSFSDPSRRFNCLLYERDNTLGLPTLVTSPAEGITSGFPRCRRACRFSTVEFTGVSLGNTVESNWLACERKCNANSSCDFWYHQDWDQKCYLQESGMSGNGRKLPKEIRQIIGRSITSGFRNCTSAPNDKSPWLGPNPDTCNCNI